MDSTDILWECLIDNLRLGTINHKEFDAVKTTVENNNKRVDAFEDAVNAFEALVDKNNSDDIFKIIECCSMLNTLILQTQVVNKLLLSKKV